MDNSYDTECFSAAQGSLGLLGVVIRMALALQPTVLVSDENNFDQYSVGETFSMENNKLKDLVQENMSVEIFWFPFNSISQCLSQRKQWNPADDKLWVKKVNQEVQIEKGPTKPWKLLLKQLADDVLSTAFSMFSPLIQQLPVLTPIYLNAAHTVVSKVQQPHSCVMLPQAIRYQGGIEKLPVYDMEFAFPVKEDFSNVIEAANVVFHEVKDFLDRDFPGGYFRPFPCPYEAHYPLNIALEMRFMGTSDVLLCPAYKREHGYSEYTCYMEVLSSAPKDPTDESMETYIEKWKEFCRKVATRWMEMDEKPIPHWAKQWQILELEASNKDIYKYIREAYGDNRINTFKEAMKKYDPDNMFVNTAFEKVFYPTDA